VGRVVPVPESIRSALAGFFGDGVSNVDVVEHSWFARLHWNAIATTRRRRIFLRGSADDFFKDSLLMLHEYCHVMNQWEPGLLTIWRYILESIRHGYQNNRFEVEARRYAADNIHKFRNRIRASTDV
jgi:hypothetical protein